MPALTHKMYVACVVATVGLLTCVPSSAQNNRSGLLTVRDGTLHYSVDGHGPALLFLHAGIADSSMWDDQVRHYRGRFTVVRFDMRGYGDSAVPTVPFIPVEDCRAVLDALRIDRALVVGASFGGTIALDFAAAYPARVAKLVLVAASPGWMPYSQQLVTRTAAIADAGRVNGPDAAVQGWMADPMLAALRRHDRLATQMRALLKRNANGILSNGLMQPPQIATPRLDQISISTLIIVGDRDDPEVVSRAQQMHQEIVGSTKVVIADAGHMVNLEQPIKFNRVLDEFLRK